MGRNTYAKDIRVSVGGQGQRKTYYGGHDNRGEAQQHQHQRGGPSHNRVWRRGKKVSFHDRRGGGGAIAKRGGGGAGGNRDGRPKFDTSRLAAVLLNDNDDNMGSKSSAQSGRARPLTRGIRGLKRGAYRGTSRDRNQFVKLAPLSEENKTQIQEAMNKRYVPGNKALDLTDFGADATFGGSSGATGKLTDERVMDVVTETIGQHLADLEALSLTNNSLRTLRVFSKIVDKAPNLKILYLDQNKLLHSRELDNISKLSIRELKLDGNPFTGNFKDGTDYSSQIQKKFRTLQVLDGNQLPKQIMFEEDGSTSGSGPVVQLPACAKMVINDQFGDFIGRFLQQYFKVYDTDNREQLAAAYHENAMMSMQANFDSRFRDETTKSDYIPESRNLNFEPIAENPGRRDRLLHQKRTQIIGFLDKLPKTQHDLTSFTLDVPFATDRLVTFSVTGAFRERNDKPHPYPIRHFSRMFTVVPQGEGLCIVNDNLFITMATKEQTERSNALFILAQETKMNLEWTKQCLDGQGWNIEQARNAFLAAKQKNEIPEEAFS